MDLALALVTIAAMLMLAAIAFFLLARMLGTIRALRGITAGLNDTLRWTLGQVAADDRSSSPAGGERQPR